MSPSCNIWKLNNPSERHVTKQYSTSQQAFIRLNKLTSIDHSNELFNDGLDLIGEERPGTALKVGFERSSECLIAAHEKRLIRLASLFGTTTLFEITLAMKSTRLHCGNNCATNKGSLEFYPNRLMAFMMKPL